MFVEPANIGISDAFWNTVYFFYEFRKLSVVTSIVTMAALVKIKSSTQTNRTFGLDVYKIRRDIFNNFTYIFWN